MLINENLTMFLIQIAVMLLAALFFGQTANKLGYPSVAGELLGGILLGPTILKNIFPAVFSALYPNNVIISTELYCFLQFGMLLFMFTSGLKIDYKYILNKRKPVLLASTLGMLIPLVLGIILVLTFPALLNAPADKYKLLYALFIGIALSISALPVIIKTLTDLNMAKSEEGTIIIGAATINDLIGWTMFACLINAFLDASALSIWLSLFKVLLFILLLAGFGAKIFKSILNLIELHIQHSAVYIGVVILFLALITAIAEEIGIHPFFAAFLFGIVIKDIFDSKESLAETRKTVSFFSTGLFAPLYFVSIGMKVNLIKDFNLWIVLIILAAACIGKITGSTVGSFLGGLKKRSAFIVGIGMNSRGAIEIIVASTAVEMNMIGQEMYVALIIMAVITSLLSGPIIKKISIDSGVTHGITMN